MSLILDFRFTIFELDLNDSFYKKKCTKLANF